MSEVLNRLMRDWPERYAPSKDDFATEPRALRDWLNHLPLANPAATSRHLLDALVVMNRLKIDPQQRLDALETLRRPVEQVVSTLDRQVVVESFPLPPARMQIGRSAQTFERELALGYVQALHDFCAPSGKIPFLKGKSVATAAVRALQHHGALLSKAYVLYHTPPAGAWQRMHDVFGAAQFLRIDDKPVSDALIGDVDLTARTAYAHALLLALSNPYRYTQREMAEVFQLTRTWAPYCTVTNGRVPDGAFGVDVESDNGPGYVPEERAAAESGMLAFDPRPLQDMIAGQMQMLPPGVELMSFRLKGGPAVEARRVFVERLVRSWVGGAERGHTRLSAGHLLDGVVGLHGVHYVLAGKEDFDSFMRRVRGQAISMSERDVIAPWVTAGADAKPVPQRARVLDQSLGGYRLLWDKGETLRAKVGELVALAPSADDDETQDWMVGVIRWIRIDDNHAVDAGVELLGRRAQPVGIASFDEHDNPRAAMRGILLLDQDNDDALTLLAPQMFDRRARELELTRPADPMDWRSEASVLRLSDVNVIDASGSFRRVLVGRAPSPDELGDAEGLEPATEAEPTTE